MGHSARVTDEQLRGTRLLESPLNNRGTAFTVQARRELGLTGLLPAVVETLEEQVERAYGAFLGYDKPINRHIYLRELQDTNEMLFYALVTEHLAEMLPIVYTPTVGEACQRFSEIYRRPRGLFVSYPDRDRIARDPGQPAAIARSTSSWSPTASASSASATRARAAWASRSASSALYTAVGGIHPRAPCRSCSTSAPTTRSGWPIRAISAGGTTGCAAQEYDEFIEEFVTAVKADAAGCAVAVGGLRHPHARPILARYRDELLTFNDDIQGTAAVAVGALTSARAVTGAQLRDQRVIMLGAGSAAIGVADMIGPRWSPKASRTRKPRRTSGWSISTVCWSPRARTSARNNAATPATAKRVDLANSSKNVHRRCPHRTVHRGRSVHRGDRPRDGRQGRPAGDLPAVQPDIALRSRPGRPGHLDRRPRAGRHRLALSRH